MKDLCGKHYGRLTVVGYDHSSGGKRFYRCQCECGKEAIVRSDQLTTGKTASCGCFLSETRGKNLQKGREKRPAKAGRPQRDGREERRKKYALKHEQPRLYRIWQSMKSRCLYKKNKCFHCYGGRGISICSEWLSSFDNFANWALKNGYSDALTIDRIDVDGNYCPENCRWLGISEQQKNKRKSRGPKNAV